MPLLSICIPTKDREKYLKTTLERIVRSSEFLNGNDIEIVISDNCSEDGTQALCEKYAEKYGDKILYVRQKEDIFDKNFTEVLRLARGKFAKLNNDTLWFPQGALSRILDVLRANEDVGLVFFHNSPDRDKNTVRCKDATEFFLETKFYSTWIGGICVNSELYKKIENVNEYSGTSFTQIAICAKLAALAPSLVVYGNFMKIQKVNKKGSYNIAEVFGESYLTVLKRLEAEKYITGEVYDKMLKPLLVNQINPYYFNFNDEYGFKRTGYFRYLFKYYKKYPYFYKSYLKYWLKSVSRIFLSVKKEEYHRKYTLFGVIKFNVKKKVLTEKHWLKVNKHNHITLKNYTNAEKITVGNYSYGEVDALFDSPDDCHLYIGNFVSIATDVLFLSASEHNYKNISTFPYKFYCINGEKEALTKGDIVVKDDVWIGARATILGGVTIEQGAVVAAGSVVTKDVPPYAIVGGCPAKVIKYRFSPEVIEKLKKIDYSKLTDEKIKAHAEALYTEIDEENADKIIEELNV